MLVGLRAAEVTLGAPERVGPHRHLWIWNLGMVDDLIGPGDDGALYVRFDAGYRRVVSAEVS